MLVVGLCGGSGSGKSTAASLFASYGIPSLNADTLYHELVSHRSACLEELCATFGEGIVHDDALDRAALSRMVFADTEEARAARKTLNRIAHAHVLAEAKRRIVLMEKDGISAVLFDAPLLFESGFHTSCDLIICVVAEENVRVARLIERDGVTREQAISRIRTQLSDEELIARSHRVIHNSGTAGELDRQVRALATEILNIANEK